MRRRRKERSGGPDAPWPKKLHPLFSQAALTSLHASLEPLLGADISALDDHVSVCLCVCVCVCVWWRVRVCVFSPSLPSHHPHQPDPVHRARTSHALATAAASLIRTAEGAAGRCVGGEGVGAELAVVARSARAAARLEVVLAAAAAKGRTR